ncbi:XPG domain containing-domain-containing protein [Podospora didyma]|uniref:XPG domain containing-domain-containing protein n=1 Tax=Podospora didyma TaxID=330526 RepID=A0AAE0U584_9PEZI|nr:XPG domain containing-domain-containing protein [Podospora didyma]
MGIPHLKRNLETYAQTGLIEPCNVAIDGPALAYHLLALCSRRVQKVCPFEQPSYDLLGQTAVAWLDKIQSCGLTVSAIYFDGFLPESKHNERTLRLVRTSQELVKYHQAFSTSVPKEKERSHNASATPVDLFPRSWGTDKRAKPPPPPFFVPAIIDFLRTSPRYGSVTKVAPGEADGFCAEHIRLHGGTVLSSDSDLLIHDLGADGSVVFIADIEAIEEEPNVLIAPQYRVSDICKRLSMKPEHGLSHLAFELLQDPYLTLPQAAERSRNGVAVSAFHDEYSRFTNQYLSPELGSSLKAKNSPDLDPRISEIALRCIGRVEPDQRRRAKCPDSVDDENEFQMYLPVLLDSPSRTSSWEPSKRVRQLAYGILQSVKGMPIPSVSEFRRLQSPSAGVRGVEVPGPDAIEIEGADLLGVLSKLQVDSDTRPPEMAWVLLSIYQDIVLNGSQGKRSIPLSLRIIREEAIGKLDQGSWDFLHVLAQVQATYYSLRMLQQIIEFTKHHVGTITGAALKLANCLSSLPSLPDFPTVRNFADTLKQARETGCLLCLATICGDYEDIVPHLHQSIQGLQKSKSKTTKKRKAASEDSYPVRPRSTNRFDLLSRDDE